MSAEQMRLATAALRIGRAFGTGGAWWTPLTPAGDGVSTARTFTAGALMRGFIVRNMRDLARQAAPGLPVFDADWLWLSATGTGLTAEQVLVSAASGTAFHVDAVPAEDMGFTIAPVSPCRAPDLATAALRRIGQGMRAGLRAGF